MHRGLTTFDVDDRDEVSRLHICIQNSPFWSPCLLACVMTPRKHPRSPPAARGQLRAYNDDVTSRCLHCHLLRVATKLRDVRLYPLQGETLVGESIKSAWELNKTKAAGFSGTENTIDREV